MNVENVVVTLSVLCLASAIYLAILSVNTVDAELRMHLVDWAVYCLIGGIAIFLCWLILQTIKRAFVREEIELQSFPF